MYDMDVDAFRVWLQSHHPQNIVGWVAQEHCCPVALWMKGLYHGNFWVSGSTVFVDNGPFSSFVAPLWVPCFVAELDARYDCHPSPVSAESALAVLDGMVLEVGYGSSY